METVAEGVHRLGSRWVNFYLLVDGGSVTVIDAGMPGFAAQLRPALDQIGRGPNDVEAIVLTHTHTDHLGVLPALVEQSGAQVFVPAKEADILRGERKPVAPKGVLSSIWRLNMLRFVAHAASSKGLSNITFSDCIPYDEGDQLDVPGRLRPVATPGHSHGHMALHSDAANVLFCGDALATFAVNTGATGPMLHPFNEDSDLALRSLDRLVEVDAGTVLFGHGDPHRGSPVSAVAAARQARAR